MSYINNNLLAGETVQATASVHWWAWGKGVVLVVLGVALQAAAAPNFLSSLLIVLGLAYVLTGLVTVWTTELAVTNRRVIAKSGLIRRFTVEVLHNKVEGLTVDQSILGRMLGFGTIHVNGTGSGRTPVPHISQPLIFRRSALEQIELPR